MRTKFLPTVVALLVFAMVVFTLASPAVGQPSTLGVNGALRTAAGEPVADGSYTLVFRLYDSLGAKKVLFEETHDKVSVNGGFFAAIVGGLKIKNLLKPDVFIAGAARWLSVQVGTDPELPRARINTVPYAVNAKHAVSASSLTGKFDGAQLKPGSVTDAAINAKYAGSETKGGPANLALGLKCTGCVQMSSVLWNQDIPLTKNTLVAKQVQAENVSVGTVYAGKLYGDGSNITGLGIPEGSCKGGQVMFGVELDGSLKCAQAKPDFSGDALGAVSHGALTSATVDEMKSTTLPRAVLDNSPKGTTDTIIIPDLGKCAGVKVFVNISAADVSELLVVLTSPGGKKITLVSKGAKLGNQIATSFPDLSKPSVGDLGGLIGSNLKGKWTLTVKDTQPSNNKIAGIVKAWSMTIVTLSAKSVRAKGKIVATGGIQHQFKDAEDFRLGPCRKTPLPCDATIAGAMCRDLTDNRLRYCNGKAWGDVAVKLDPKTP